MSKRQEKPYPEDLEFLEAHLAGTLRPVVPPRDFASRLRDRIHLPERRVLVSRLQDWNRLFIVFGSVISGMLLVVTLARAFYYLVGRRT